MALIGFNRRLTWADFPKVDESRDGKHDAFTYCDIRVKTPESIPTNASGKWTLKESTVTVSLSASESWVVKGKESPDLLKHEQRHYDIFAVAARQIDGRLRNLSGTGEVQAAIELIVNEVYRTLDKVQLRYDEDSQCGTDHGLRKNLQVRWDHRLSNAKANRKSTVDQLDSCPAKWKTDAARAK